MIRGAIIYRGSHAVVVAAYEKLPLAAKKPEYWEDAAITPLRKKIKDHYLKVQAYRCCYCQVELSTGHGRVWDVEHIVSRRSHPQFLFEPQNLAVACVDCNGAKRDANVLVNPKIKRYPRRSAAFLLVHPHYDNYNDHIGVFLGRFYFPKSEKGEQTITMCGLLRYAYKLANWDSGIADNSKLFAAFSRAMSASDPQEQRTAMLEAIIILGVPVLR